MTCLGRRVSRPGCGCLVGSDVDMLVSAVHGG